MTEPTLNSRAAKVMGWTIAQAKDIYQGRCITGPCSMADPAKSLDDAAIVRDKAIEKCGFVSYLHALGLACELITQEEFSAFVRVAMEDDEEWPVTVPQMRSFTLATPAQITEAAVRCLEKSGK